ncbi:MAG: DUF1385 domain-containing protein [Coriobacteriaceae bacterium]|nr:DUF1385 domain-containing protein [Coriobacteriaceae bacterium]
MGESKNAFKADVDVSCRTHIGGQALIEGIMMRGRYNWAVAVREPDGNIYTEEHDLASGRKKNSWMYWPIIRGCTAFVESLILGFKALNIAADHAYDFDEDEEDSTDTSEAADEVAAAVVDTSAEPVRSEAPVEEAAKDDKEESGGMPAAVMGVSMVVGIVLGIAIFVAVPALLSNLILGEAAMNTVWWNILDGLLRVAIFVAYMWLISLMKDIKRMYGYHGAEHKTIHCYEHALDMTPENAQQFPTLHVRCGTAFMVMVLIIAILVYTILGGPINALIDLTGVTGGPLRFLLVVLTRIILMPIIAGVGYEITVKWAGSRPENPLVKVILWPGMQMQRLTTNPPDDGMIECAIAAMQLVLDREDAEAAEQEEAARMAAPAAAAA